MVTVNNIVSTRLTIALGEHGNLRSKLMDKATSGLKNDNSVVDAILGAKAQSAASVGREVLKQLATGFNITNTAIATLENIQKQIEEAKLSTFALNTADATALSAGQTAYINQMNKIIATLSYTDFAGKKLFDGTLSLGSTAATQLIPANAAPLSIQAGINFADVINVIIERLLAGDGTVADITVAGVHNPLFPTTAADVAAITASATVANTILTTATTDQAAHTTAFSAPLVTAQAVAVAFPAGGNIFNALDNAINTAVVTNGIVYPNANGNLGNRSTVKNNLQAIVTTAAAVLTGMLNHADSGVTTAEINTARDAVNNLIVDTGPDVGSVRTSAQNAAAQAPAGSNATLVAVYAALNAAAKQAGIGAIIVALAKLLDTNVDGHGNGQPSQEQNIATALIIAIINTIAPLVNVATVARNHGASVFDGLRFGTVTTSAGRTAALQLLENANNKLTAVVANLKGQRNNFVQAQASMQIQIVQLDDAANNYLSADYEKIIPSLTELSKKDKVSTLSFYLSEGAINAAIDQLAQAATVA